MHFNVNDETKLLSVWITDDEIICNKLPMELEKKLEDYRRKKYRIVFYKSGTNDLKKDVLNLILNNAKI